MKRILVFVGSRSRRHDELVLLLFVGLSRKLIEGISGNKCLVGRETLEAAVRQGEQLRNAENLADETEYKLDRATRLLKGMTWAGWFANKFTSDIEAPQYKTKSDVAPSGPPRVYEDVPTSCMLSLIHI